MENTEQNPLLQPSNLPNQAADFPRIKAEHYVPAIKKGIELARARVEKIKSMEASFKATIVGLEQSSQELDRISSIYFNLFSAEASEQHQALAGEMSALLSNYQSDVTLDDDLFAKVKEVYDKRSSLNLDMEDAKLLEETYTSFTRNGALLSPTDKETLRRIDQELSGLSPKFSENLLKAKNSYQLFIDSESDLTGLPESAIEAAKAAAEQKGQPDKWFFNLDYPSLLPFLTYNQNRELREQLWRANASVATSGEHDNRGLIKSIVELRDRRAKLLGAKNHAAFVLQKRMAEAPERVDQFLKELIPPSLSAAKKEIQTLREFAKDLDGLDQIMPWDLAYYREKLKQKTFQFEEEQLRPYFKLENVIDGVFLHAEKLYGLTFKPASGYPTYHPDVKVFEVFKKDSNDFVGVFYADFFPRETKRGGAWMTNYREQGLEGDDIKRPLVSIVCNFTKPTPSKPSLLTFQEVQTLFHEFGHSLHSLLSQCRYQSLSGTNVYWDFVELPSQIFENWTLEKQSLDLFAKHYETGAPIPSDLCDKLVKSSQFMAGYDSCRQLRFATLDMTYHTLQDFSKLDDIEAFEVESTKELSLLPHVDGTLFSTSFSHIFAGGYSAGYYSYKWAEVLDADAFEAFKENGLFDPKTASSFHDNILSQGGREHPMELYKRFRGREPDPQALLRRAGLV